MRFFDSKLVANSALHARWWGEQAAVRDFFHNKEQELAAYEAAALGLHVNATSLLSMQAWLELDTITTQIMRSDDGEVWMNDLMPLAKSVNIGKLVHISRVSSDMSDEVIISMSGQAAVPVDKVDYDTRGAPVPIFAKGYGREWREWNSLQSENFDALADDQEAAVSKIKKAQARYVLNGDPRINVDGYKSYGIMNSPMSKAINLGTGAGGANIDLTTATADEIDTFISQTLGAMLDANKITGKVNLYVSPEIGRSLDRRAAGAEGFRDETIFNYLLKNRRINKIAVSTGLTGNQFFGFVASAAFIRPLVGMAVNTTARARLNPRDNYHFEVMGALGIDIRGDYAGNSGVFYSTVVN